MGKFGLGNEIATATSHGGIESTSRFGYSVYRMADSLDASIIFVPSFSGATARRIARYRLPIWVVAITRDDTTCKRLVFVYGIHPVAIHTAHLPEDPTRWRDYVLGWLQENDVAGAKVLLVEGSGTLGVADTRRIDIIDLEDQPLQ